MSASPVLHRSTIVELAGFNVDAKIDVAIDCSARIQFTAGKKACDFTVGRWGGAGNDSFMRLFHAHEHRDAATFGTGDEPASPEQRQAAVARACEDIMVVWRQICNSHGRGALDYAVWYRDSRLAGGYVPKSYKDAVQLVTCEGMAHCQFVVPGLSHGVINPLI